MNGDEHTVDAVEQASGLPDPQKGCRDGYQFRCGYGCGATWNGDDFASITRRAARHFNQKHADDLRGNYEVIETVERGGHHIQDDFYQVERIDIFVTPFDMAEGAGEIDGFLSQPAAERVCPECNCVVRDEDDRVEDNPDDVFDDSWTCTECIEEARIKRRADENQQITEWSA